MIKHGVGRRVIGFGPLMHLTAADDVYAGRLLIQDLSLASVELRVGHVPGRERTCLNLLLERLVSA